MRGIDSVAGEAGLREESRRLDRPWNVSAIGRRSDRGAGNNLEGRAASFDIQRGTVLSLAQLLGPHGEPWHVGTGLWSEQRWCLFLDPICVACTHAITTVGSTAIISQAVSAVLLLVEVLTSEPHLATNAP